MDNTKAAHLGPFTEADTERLAGSIKNRITTYVLVLFTLSVLIRECIRIKTGYNKKRGELSETGQGLIDNGLEAEITPGSELANVWGMFMCVCAG